MAKKIFGFALVLLAVSNLATASEISMGTQVKDTGAPLANTKIIIDFIGYPPTPSIPVQTGNTGIFTIDSKYLGQTIGCNEPWGFCFPTTVINDGILFVALNTQK